MQKFNISGIMNRFAEVIASRRRQREFLCSDCERWQHCGLPPSETCIVKAAQLAQGDWKLRRRAKALSRFGEPIGF